ncbi:DUF4254 domain-containing protein [Nocardia caishijiensis]|uniref:DUF4254 domain-containing protein n=1 Tax=Nocardia caishijiensis TaxID=184756 RepID=A0ABQ6YQ15_9NOCA|nr:DUF4254 domain-containing protein [Nocardia caishijiensis]KAF0847821.1 hypothetical protein FNL39_103723 [Nocardia caishijiensis]
MTVMRCETRFSVDRTRLPGRELMLAAFRGLSEGYHPVLHAAAELAVLHQVRDRTPAFEAVGIDRRRAQLMRAIDRWVILAAPLPSVIAAEHCETLGMLVDRLAAHSVRLFVTLVDAPDAEFYDEWVRLDALAESYQCLIDELWAGSRCLPVVVH